MESKKTKDQKKNKEQAKDVNANTNSNVNINKKINVDNKISSKMYFVLSETISALVIVLSLVILVLAAYNVFQIRIKNHIYSNFFGKTLLEVKSGSMEDEIFVGDVIVVDILEREYSLRDKEKSEITSEEIDRLKSKLKVEDIITYKKKNSLVTHRIVELNEKNIVTKGDANNANDDPISYSDVVGRVVNVIPNIGLWKKILSEKQVIIPFSASIILIIVTMLIDTDDKKQDKKRDEINSNKREENEKRTKIQKGKRFKK